MSKDNLEESLRNLSRFDRDRFRAEAEAYQQEQQRRQTLEIQERLEREMYHQVISMPSVLTVMPSPFGQAFGAALSPVERKPSVDQSRLDALKAAEPHKVTKRMPDLMEVITAWRGWAVTQDGGEWRLKALGKSHIWQPRAQVDAVCDGGKNHPAPNYDCQCGVWAFKELDGLVSALNRYSDIRVLGNVQLWGRVIETENGYRAQYAYPSELWLFDNSLEELGYIYGVPVRTV
jgi:hypothetical protein